MTVFASNLRSLIYFTTSSRIFTEAVDARFTWMYKPKLITYKTALESNNQIHFPATQCKFIQLMLNKWSFWENQFLKQHLSIRSENEWTFKRCKFSDLRKSRVLKPASFQDFLSDQEELELEWKFLGPFQRPPNAVTNKLQWNVEKQNSKRIFISIVH